MTLKRIKKMHEHCIDESDGDCNECEWGDICEIVRPWGHDDHPEHLTSYIKYTNEGK